MSEIEDSDDEQQGNAEEAIAPEQLDAYQYHQNHHNFLKVDTFLPGLENDIVEMVANPRHQVSLQPPSVISLKPLKFFLDLVDVLECPWLMNRLFAQLSQLVSIHLGELNVCIFRFSVLLTAYIPKCFFDFVEHVKDPLLEGSRTGNLQMKNLQIH